MLTTGPASHGMAWGEAGTVYDPATRGFYYPTGAQ